MDLETENRLATLLMEEARRLRAQADKEGVNVYLRQPNVRGRPNSRFLTATVLGVEQSNRAVEVSELWRAREKELELNTKLKSGEKHKNRCCGDKWHHDGSYSKCSSGHGQEKASISYTSSFSNHGCDEDGYHDSDDGGLRDDEVEEFLQSRAKRGRGATGSRMDEPGPYPLSRTSDTEHLVNPDMRLKEEWENRILGPKRPPMLAGTRKSHEPPHDEGGGGSVDGSKKKHHSRGKKSERSKEKKKKSKHHSHKSRRRRGSDSE